MSSNSTSKYFTRFVPLMLRSHVSTEAAQSTGVLTCDRLTLVESYPLSSCSLRLPPPLLKGEELS